MSKLDFILKAIQAPWDNSNSLRLAISDLRAAGEVVIQLFPNESDSASIYEFDRKLVLEDGTWKVISI